MLLRQVSCASGGLMAVKAVELGIARTFQLVSEVVDTYLGTDHTEALASIAVA